MSFGIKKKYIHRFVGVKQNLHRASAFGVKALPVIEMMNPEFLPELETTRQVLRKVSKLTK
jgi:hypothetical protein